MFAGGTEGGASGQPSTGLRIENGVYNQLCKQNLVWPGTAFAEEDVKEAEFVPRTALRLEFCWA